MSDMHIDPEELRDSARRLLDKEVDRRAPYADAPSGDGGALRGKMAELGWMLLTTPEAMDGLGQSFVALAPIYQELGRALASVPFAGSMAAVDAIAAAPDAGELLASIGTGEMIVAIAEGARIEGGRANGALSDVPDAGLATHLLLLGDDALALVDLSGVSRERVETWDRTRDLADIRLDGAEARILLTGDAAREAGAVARAHLDLAIACDSIGGAERALEEAIAYMGTRQQFNRPIGSFQALKHRAADLKVGLEIARAFLGDAAHAYVDRRQGWESIAAQAKLLAADAYRAIAEESVQFHGGIGFTWEHDCHLFLKRALLNEMLGGTPDQYRDRIAPDVLRRAFAA